MTRLTMMIIMIYKISAMMVPLMISYTILKYILSLISFLYSATK